MRQKATGKTLRFALGVAFASTGLFGCGGGTSTNNSALPEDVKAILFLQRTPRDSEGNVFDYASYEAGGRLVKLEPPSADGTLTPVVDLDVMRMALGTPDLQGIDIQSYDLSFDARTVVFSAQRPATTTRSIR